MRRKLEIAGRPFAEDLFKDIATLIETHKARMTESGVAEIAGAELDLADMPHVGGVQ